MEAAAERAYREALALRPEFADVYLSLGNLAFNRRDYAKAAEAYDRAFYPEGVARQIAAIAAHGNRRPGLEALDLPALVIHGADDPLVRVEGGHDTHQALRGSKLKVVQGMGHDLPEALWPEIVEAIDELTRAS